MAFQILFRFLRCISSNSVPSMNYPIINVSAFLNCYIETVSIFVIFYFVIQKTIMKGICYIALHCVNMLFLVTFQFSYIQISTSVWSKAPQR